MEMSGEVSASSQVEKDQTQTEVIEDDPLCPNSIVESEQTTEVQEGGYRGDKIGVRD